MSANEASVRWASRCAAGVATAVFVLVIGTAACAGTYHRLLPSRFEPATHRSYVRTIGAPLAGGGLGPGILIWDHQYASQARAMVPAGSVDVAMQQCFGGGFLNDFRFRGPASHTIGTASRYDEVANNNDQIIRLQNLDNWTRAYRDAARGRPLGGMLDYWELAALGDDGIAKDPYALNNGGPNTERPWYWTPDNEPPNSNNDRTLFQGSGLGDDQYAILLSWTKPDQRHMVNIQRMYWMLRNDFGVPQGNIVVMFANAVPNSSFPPYSHVDPLIPTTNIPLDGPSTLTFWNNALSGNLFKQPNGTVGGNVPDGNDKLFIYNTGHGGHARRTPTGWVRTTATNVVRTDAPLDLIADGMSFAFAPGTPEASTIMNDGDDILIQLLLRQQINSSAIINLPTVGSVLASDAFVLDLAAVYQYNDAIDEPTFAYQFSVDQPTLAGVASSFEFSIENLDSPFVDENLIAALTFVGGDQEHAYLTAFPIPEPTAFALLAIGLLVFVQGRRRGVGASTHPTRLWHGQGAPE